MNKSPLNYLISVAIIAILWVVFAIFMGDYFSQKPNLADKTPESFANDLRIIFGIGAFIAIICICYWFYYGSLESTASEMDRAKRKWNGNFIFLIIVSVCLTVTLIIMNMKQGIQPQWFCMYFGVLSALTFISFWITSFLLSPLTVKYIPLGKR